MAYELFLSHPCVQILASWSALGPSNRTTDAHPNPRKGAKSIIKPSKTRICINQLQHHKTSYSFLRLICLRNLAYLNLCTPFVHQMTAEVPLHAHTVSSSISYDSFKKRPASKTTIKPLKNNSSQNHHALVFQLILSPSLRI